MKIAKATRKYETWLGRRLNLVESDLELKNQQMAAGLFPFFRATFYRWAQLWPKVCPEAAQAPYVLAVGDLHVENFGTWRDVEGRLVWGVNDLDEAYSMPYTIDLVRLGASVHVAIDAAHLSLSRKDACDGVLEGYRDALQAGGRPVVLGEHHHWLRELASSSLRDPAPFWAKLKALRTVRERVPTGAVRALEALLPERGLPYRLVHRVAGLGSLGRERYLALADWRGGEVAREAKALAPSAYYWANGSKGSERIAYERVLCEAVRCRDPFVHLRGRWIVRRLAPDCCRIELGSLPSKRDEHRLLYEMGWETANIHLGTRRAAKTVLKDLDTRRPNWLHRACEAMVRATTEDWEEWKAHTRASSGGAKA